MEEKERYEYYPKQNQLYDKINDELYCLGIKQDKTRLVDFLNLMNEDWWTLYERNKELREENQQLKQQIAESEERINWLVEAEFNRKWAKKYVEMRRKEDPMLCLPDSDEVYEKYFELKQQLHDLPKKIVGEITNELSNNTSLYFEMRESTSANCPNKEYEWFNYVRFRNYINTILEKFGAENE